MEIERNVKRIAVEIPVTIITVLDTHEASIVDLTERGALVAGFSVPVGTRFQIEYMGQTLYAQCRWAEIDRMGVKFLFPCNEGPLHDRLEMARAATIHVENDSGLALAMAPIHNGYFTRGARTFSRLAVGGFGRRS